MGKSKRYRKKKFRQIIVIISLLIILAFFYKENNSDFMQNVQSFQNILNTNNIANTNSESSNISLENIPEYKNKVYVELNNNKPYFDEKDLKNTKPFENYSELDKYGRCGVCFANICKETMPKNGEKRESISRVKPTGWQQTKINGEYLYNRCHLIAYQLADENANEKNLITGTRYFNVEGMLPFEDKVADYIKQNQNNHVLYRVTPIFAGENLLANGVEMEGYSVEDNGKGICFNVFVYNVQPGVEINYLTGKAK